MAWTATDRRNLVMFTIYDHPRDHPNSWVVRRWVVRRLACRPDEMRLAGSLEEARDLLPPGVTRLPRGPDDDPRIVETWL